ncbi:hypothetical protein IV55_GL001361 [Furfurilactobacillus siliginis]|uniref:Immunity protein Imm33 domain-containing protein n=2 Tax=Furfurilactobacillus siliginis TaxID=348151 RepID=A0A0R2L3X6_9LACO|nr:hypothetical protein IV55_GL001361 [Furfurilactobacillus siliginis]
MMSENEITAHPLKGAGASLVSNTILSGDGILKYAIREDSVADSDNGWRFFADDDNDPLATELTPIDFNLILQIQPAVFGIFDYPAGTTLQLVISDNGAAQWWDNDLAHPVKVRTPKLPFLEED